MFDVMSYLDGPTFEINGTIYGRMTVTKEIAELALGYKYEQQRNERPNWVEYLSREMSAGRFVSNNGQTLVWDEDGNNADGQHRLEAIAKTGIPQTFCVAIIKREDAQRAFETLDNASKRSMAMYMSGPSKTARTTVATIDYCIRHGEAPLLSTIQGKVTGRSQASRTEVVSHNRDNEDYITQVTREANRMREAIGKGSMVSLGSFICIVRFVNGGYLLDEFIDDFTSTVPSNRTVQACINMIRRQYMSGKAPTQKWVFGTLLDAYEHYREMDESVMLNKQSKRIDDYDKKMQTERKLPTE